MTISSIIAIMGALITALFGYRLNKMIIAFSGFVIAFSLSRIYLPDTIDENLTIIISLIIAIIIGLLSGKIYLIGIFLLWMTSTLIMLENINFTENKMMLGIIIGIIAGIIGVKFDKHLIIIGTSFAGSSVITTTLSNIYNINQYISIIILLTLTSLTLIFQFKHEPS